MLRLFDSFLEFRLQFLYPYVLLLQDRGDRWVGLCTHKRGLEGFGEECHRVVGFGWGEGLRLRNQFLNWRKFTYWSKSIESFIELI